MKSCGLVLTNVLFALITVLMSKATYAITYPGLAHTNYPQSIDGQNQKLNNKINWLFDQGEAKLVRIRFSSYIDSSIHLSSLRNKLKKIPTGTYEVIVDDHFKCEMILVASANTIKILESITHEFEASQFEVFDEFNIDDFAPSLQIPNLGDDLKFKRRLQADLNLILPVYRGLYTLFSSLNRSDYISPGAREAEANYFIPLREAVLRIISMSVELGAENGDQFIFNNLGYVPDAWLWLAQKHAKAIDQLSAFRERYFKSALNIFKDFKSDLARADGMDMLASQNKWKFIYDQSNEEYLTIGIKTERVAWVSLQKNLHNYNFHFEAIPDGFFYDLGVKTDVREIKKAQKAILRFIYSSEGILAEILPKLSKVRAEQFHTRKIAEYGSLVIENILVGLANGPNFKFHPGFSVARYYQNTLDIFIELLEANSVSIKNPGTYRSILYNAIYFASEAERDFNASDANNSIVRDKLLRLHNIIKNNHLSTIEALYAQSDQKQIGICAQLFL